MRGTPIDPECAKCVQRGIRARSARFPCSRKTKRCRIHRVFVWEVWSCRIEVACPTVYSYSYKTHSFAPNLSTKWRGASCKSNVLTEKMCEQVKDHSKHPVFWCRVLRSNFLTSHVVSPPIKSYQKCGNNEMRSPVPVPGDATCWWAAHAHARARRHVCDSWHTDVDSYCVVASRVFCLLA